MRVKEGGVGIIRMVPLVMCALAVLTGCAESGGLTPDGSCFVVTRQSAVQDDGFTRTTTIDRDQAGNMIKVTIEDGENSRFVTDYSVDDNGNCFSQIDETVQMEGSPGGLQLRNYEITKNDDGVMTEQYWEKSETNSPDTFSFEDAWKMETWQYGADGKLQVKTRERQADFACDEYEKWAVTYNSEGYPVKEEGRFSALGDDGSTVEGSATVIIDWEYDSEGKATGFALRSNDEQVQYYSGQHYSVETDQYGNITKVWSDESPGTYYEYEYTLINNPSAFVAANSCKSYFGWITWFIEPEKALRSYTGYSLHSPYAGYPC